MESFWDDVIQHVLKLPDSQWRNTFSDSITYHSVPGTIVLIDVQKMTPMLAIHFPAVINASDSFHELMFWKRWLIHIAKWDPEVDALRLRWFLSHVVCWRCHIRVELSVLKQKWWWIYLLLHEVKIYNRNICD